MLFALSLDGIAGVCGVCGEIGFPGDVETDMDVPATIAGKLDNFRLEEVEDCCSMSEDDIESDKAAFDSLIRWNLDKAALVRLVEASVPPLSLGDLKLLRSFF